MMLSKDYYRRYGVRLLGHMSAPKSMQMELLDITRESIVHYWGSGANVIGPDANEFLFRNIKRPIPVLHLTQVGDMLGQPRNAMHPIEPNIRRYHTMNRRYRRVHEPEKAMSELVAPLVCNYSMIDHLYKYNRNIFQPWYRWWNVAVAVAKEMDLLASTCDRQQYIMIGTPSVLPTVSLLRRGEAGLNQSLLKILSTPEHWFLLELWKWAGEERKTSLFGKIKDANLAKINIIFTVAGRWSLVNLGVINDWRKNSNAGDAKGIEPKVFQKYLFRMMMSINNVKSGASIDDDTIKDADAKIVDAAKDDNARLVATKQTNDVNGNAEKTTTLVAKPEADEHLPADTKDTVKRDAKVEEDITKDIEAFEVLMNNLMNAEPVQGTTVSEPTQITDETHLSTVYSVEPEYQSLQEGVTKACESLADAGRISAAEYRRYMALPEAVHKIPSFDGKSTLVEASKIPPESLVIKDPVIFKDIPTVPDKSMLKSSLEQFDPHYIKHVFHKDVANMVLNIQNAGVCVTDMKKERVESVMGSYDDFIVKVTPVEGASGTLRFKLPAVDEDGSYRSNGVSYKLRKQRRDLPIHKVAPDKVALTSYYGKTFITRSEKRVNNYAQWITNAIMAKGLDDADNGITNLIPANVFDNHANVPRLYSTMAMSFKGFSIPGWNLSFDYRNRAERFDAAVLKQYEQGGMVVVGDNGRGQYLLMDKFGAMYQGNQGTLTGLPPLQEMIGLPDTAAPVDFTELKVMGKTIPLGIVLAYRMGLEELMTLLKTKPKRFPLGTRVAMESNEFMIKFRDETLVFSRDDSYASMIMGGFKEYHNVTRDFDIHEFDKKSVYFNLLDSAGMGARYLRKIDSMFQLFVDPITKDLLVEMKEPTDFRGLLLRCNQLLLSDRHPDEFDSRYLRLCGYERMAGAVYAEICKAIDMHAGRAGKAKQPIDLNPYAVWNQIAKDPSVSLVQDINPIENLKEQEAVTYGGTGGRGSRTMTKHTRAYHPSDMGTISEATKDSSDVGINTYTSANPQLTSLRGMSRPVDPKSIEPASLFSTSALISPGADRDDGKRVNFISIQHGHAVACKGYHQLPVRTGYEQVIANRTSDMFAYTAKDDGKVIEANEHGIIIEYKDGTRKGIEIGRRYGHAGGLVIPHEIVSNVKVGQTLKRGDLVSYNKGFFEPDKVNKGGAAWKAGMLVKTVLMECNDTLEDGSAISQRVAEQLATVITKPRSIVVNFDQEIRKLVKVGQDVAADDILCIIEDAVTANSNLFDEESIDTLRMLGAQAPQAKFKGLVERIEVFYHGDKEDMSPTLRAIAAASDRELTKRHLSAGKKGFNGSVDEGYRVDGDPLALDTAVIHIYLSAEVPAGSGDKAVFANQMKSTFGKIMDQPLRSESGVEIDAVFGMKSVYDRIVLSPILIGTTTTLLEVITKKVLDAYNN